MLASYVFIEQGCHMHIKSSGMKHW